MWKARSFLLVGSNLMIKRFCITHLEISFFCLLFVEMKFFFDGKYLRSFSFYPIGGPFFTARLYQDEFTLFAVHGINYNSDLTPCFLTSIGNAGTAMRPLAGVLCAGEGSFVLDGTPRMRERPIDDLVDGLLQVRFYSNSSSPLEMI